MKTLYLLRHAKSSRADTSLPDRERPLEPRGERDATKMGRRWSQRNVKPDLIMSSPAVRALATAKVVAQGLEYKAQQIMVDDRLYAATEDTLIAVIEALDDTLDRVMLVGHNPGSRRWRITSTARSPTCRPAPWPNSGSRLTRGLAWARPGPCTRPSIRPSTPGHRPRRCRCSGPRSDVSQP